LETTEKDFDLYISDERTIWERIKSELKHVPIFPLIVIFLFVLFGLFGFLIAPYDPNAISFGDTLVPPFWAEGGSTKYLLGTDHFGRDILSRIIIGTSISLQVGFLSVFIAGFVGAVVASVSGYLGGAVDAVLMRLVDMVISFPFLILCVTLVAVVGAGKNNIIIILGIVSWAWYARVLRAEVLRLRDADFVRLAIVAGCSKTRIMVRHIFPNIINSLVIMATLSLGVYIIAEASLSFLGLGVPPPDPSWGNMVSEGRNYIGQAWWICTFPGIAILLVVLSFNILGDWLRVRLDPKFRQTMI
jgi:peptide/nickel transport system permease protein